MEEKQYYYAENEKAVGPYTIDKLRKLLESGLISRETHVAPEGTDDWRQLEYLLSDATDSVGSVSTGQRSIQEEPCPHAKSQSAATARDKVKQSWSTVSRWPNAFIFAGAIFLLVGYFQAGSLGGGPLDWGLHTVEAFLRLLAMLICFAAIKAIKNARKAKDVKGFKNFCVSLLTALLFIEAGFNGIMFPVQTYRSFNAYRTAARYANAAPGEFRASIRNECAMIVIGDDALVLRSIIQASHPKNDYERRLQLLRKLGNASMTPLTEEYYYLKLGINEMLLEDYRNLNINQDPGVLLQITEQLKDRDARIQQEYRRLEARIAEFYDFRNWNELRDYAFDQFGADLPQSRYTEGESRIGY